MFDSLRRVLWLVPTLSVGAALLFFVLNRTIARSTDPLPLFVHLAPQSAEKAAERTLARLEAGDPDAARELARLGGAAFPFVLARLPSLPVKEQRQVAEALWPVARRMGLADAETWLGRPTSAGRDEEPSTDGKLVFWQRYFEDHALEFRPLSVERLVKRLAARDLHLRRTDLLLLDTYALPALVAHLGRVQNERDVERARRLVELIAHVTGESWSVPPGASPEDTRRVVAAVRRYWDLQGADWTQLGPVELAAAHLSQTQFAVWARRSARELTGFDHTDLMARVQTGVRVSAPLLLLTFTGALFVGPACAALLTVSSVRGRGRRKLLARGALVFLLFLSIPGALLRPPETPILAGLLGLAVAALGSAHLLTRELGTRLDWRTRFVIARRSGARRLGTVLAWTLPALPTFAPLAAAEVLLVVTCLELGARAPGLGKETFDAVQTGDVSWLMMACLTFGLLTGVLQLLADGLLGVIRWPWRSA